MCAIQMLCKTGTLFLGMVDPYFISARICVRTFRTHLHSLLPEDLALALKQVLSLCPILVNPPLISGGDM